MSDTENTEEEFEFEEEGEATADKLKKLRADLKAALKEKEEYLTGWQRAKADLVNARKDMETQSAERLKFANRELIHSLIPVLDSFDSAVSGKSWNDVDPSWRNGVEMIHTQLLSALKASGAEPFDPKGEAFSPEAHEPMQMVEKGDLPAHHVKETLQRGWRYHGKIIRPAKVVVTDE